MALGLNTFHLKMSDFWDQLHRFDSVTLNAKNEFVCWDEGACSFYIVDDVSDTELHDYFAASVQKQHAELLLEKICEKCGSGNSLRTEGSARSFDDREVAGVLQQVEIEERWVGYECRSCGHERVVLL